MFKEKNSNIKNVNDNMDQQQYKIAYDKVMDLYQNLGYFDIYSPFIVGFIILTISVIFLIVYINIEEKIKPIRDNWETERCKPYVLPFAGIINLPEGSNFLEFTGENFEYCVQDIIKNISGPVLDPVNFITSSLTDMYGLISVIINTIRDIISSIRSDFSDITVYIYDKIMDFIIRIEQMFIKILDIFGRIGGILTVMLYTGESLLLIFESMTDLTLRAAVNFLIALLVMISVMTVIAIATLDIALLPVLLGLVALYTTITIPTSIYINFMTNVLHYNTGVNVPTCFDKNTIIKKSNGKEVYISDIKVGDVLENNSIVQSFFELKKMTEPMYLLDNIKVSGTHRVLYDNNWILVSKHPYAKIIHDYPENILYCLNTSNKIIKINNTIFSDWDDVNIDNKYKLLTEQKENIHTYYDKGFPSNTLIKTINGKEIYISDIKIGEVLESINDEIIFVYGKVIINSNDLLDGNLLKSNITYLGNYYHLLTNKGIFKINNIIYNDFNYCIDKYYYLQNMYNENAF
jgi:hypothetical protein